MTGRELFRRVTRRTHPWREDELQAAKQHAALWSVVLESTAAGGRLARALEAEPWRLDADPHELVRWLEAVEGLGDGRAGKVVAVLGLAGQLVRLVRRAESEDHEAA